MYQPTLGLALTALAFLVGSIIFYRFTRERGFTSRETGWVLAAALCGGIIGAKITRLLFAFVAGASPESLMAHPDGRTIIGGILFGWFAVELAKKRLKIDRSTGDGFALALSIGEAIGRIGCFFNNCCYGAVASVPWAVYQVGAMRHPAQLYSCVTAFAIFCVLLSLRKKVQFEGDLFRIYLILFGVTRFFLEFVRERADNHFGLSSAQWVSLEITAAMVLAIAWNHRRQQQADSSGSVSGSESVERSGRAQ